MPAIAFPATMRPGPRYSQAPHVSGRRVTVIRGVTNPFEGTPKPCRGRTKKPGTGANEEPACLDLLRWDVPNSS